MKLLILKLNNNAEAETKSIWSVDVTSWVKHGWTIIGDVNLSNIDSLLSAKISELKPKQLKSEINATTKNVENTKKARKSSVDDEK